jgi:ATP-dependent DNA helicase DinG
VGPMRDKLLTDKTAVFTSATLMLGGDFRRWRRPSGLKPTERVGHQIATTETRRRCRGRASTSARRSTTASRSILYVARPPAASRSRRARPGAARRDLRPRRRPRRPHAGPVLLTRRAAETAGGGGAGPSCRTSPRSPRATPSCPSWPSSFVEDPHTCLFGTLLAVGRASTSPVTLPAGDHRPDPVPRHDDPLMVGAREVRPTRPAATASCRSPPPTPRCCWRRAPAG